MSEQNADSPILNAGEDPIVQLKGETSRKLDNVNKQLESLAQQNALLVESLNRLSAPPPPPAAEKEDLSSIMYRDPVKYAQIIKDSAKAEIRQENMAQGEQQARINSIMADITSEYPELGDKNSALTKKAVETWAAMPENERANPISYKLAAKEAAMELGVKPRSKRTADEDFMGPSEGSSAQRRNRPAKMDPVTEAWAELLNVDLSNPEVKARIEERSKRNWNKYSAPIPSKKGGRK